MIRVGGGVLTSSMGGLPRPPDSRTHHLRLVWIRTTAGMEASCFHLRLIVSFPPVQERRGLGRSAWREGAGNGRGGKEGGLSRAESIN